MFHYESLDETLVNPEDIFRINVFYPLVDCIITSLESRFEQLNSFNDNWSFLFDFSRPIDEPQIIKSCLNLERALTHNFQSDISGPELAQEIISLSLFLE